MRYESIEDYTKSNILGKYASLDNFINTWTQEQKKEVIKEKLLEQGIDLEQMKKDHNMENVDDFDFICHVAYDVKPLTRKERANNVKKRDFLNRYNDAAKQVLETLLERYADVGIEEIETTSVLRLEPFKEFGTPSKIVKEIFGGREFYMDAIHQLTNELYRVGA